MCRPNCLLRSGAAALAAVPLFGVSGTMAPAEEAATPSAAELMDALMWNRGPIGGPFDLIDQHGQRRTDAEFHGRLLVIYFGYSIARISARLI
jgi:cytochrome oxidase Cu insertion factor (SCO1/SenC/PrrC family)